MQIREHLGANKPAVILHPSGAVVTFDELEARAGWRTTFAARVWSKATPSRS